MESISSVIDFETCGSLDMSNAENSSQIGNSSDQTLQNRSEVEKTEKNPSIFPSKLCELCNKQFLTSWSFSRHMKKIHEVEVIKVGSRKKFRCDVGGCEWNGASRQGLLSHKIKYHSVKPRQKPVRCPECCERFHTVKNLAKHALDEHKIEGQNFELQSRSFRSRAEFNDFMQYIKMETSGEMTTISVKDKCTYMRCEMAGKARHLADSLSKRVSHGTKKVISHCTCFMNVRVEENGAISVEYVLGHLGHEKTPMKIRYTALEIEAVLLLLKEKRSPDWISQYLKENTLESDTLHAMSSADIRSIMCSYLNNAEQEEILGIEREEASLSRATVPHCNSSALLGTISGMEPLTGEESASDNERDIMEMATPANISRGILSGDRLEDAEHSSAFLVEDVRLKLMELLDLVFHVSGSKMEELNCKVSDALSFAKQNMSCQTDYEVLSRNSHQENVPISGVTSYTNVPEAMIHRQNTIGGHGFRAVSRTLTRLHEMGNFTV